MWATSKPWPCLVCGTLLAVSFSSLHIYKRNCPRMRLRFARSNIGRGGSHKKTIRSTSSKRSSICKPTWWSCCSQCLRVRITDFKIMKTYRDFPGNVLNGTIGKQMVDTLVESTSNVEVQQCLLSFCSTFHPFHFHVSQHFLNTFTSIFFFLIHARSNHSCSSPLCH